MDLKSFGIQYVLGQEPLPSAYEIATVEKQNRSLLFTLGSTVFSLLMGDSIGSGSYGEVVSVVGPGEPIIVKIVRKDKGITLQSVVEETIVQIILAEGTKHLRYDDIQLYGPFVPKLIMMGQDSEQYYIVSERMEGVLFERIHRNHTSSFLQTCMVHLSKILMVLSEMFQFNHRDLKHDNIMFTTVNGDLQIRLIDFGFSCLTYNGVQIDPGSLFHFQHCFLETRDMHSFFHQLTKYSYYSANTLKINRLLRILVSSTQVEPEWLQTYNQYNAMNGLERSKPYNLKPEVVYNVFRHITFFSQSLTTSFDAEWTKYLVHIDSKTIQYFTNEEISNLPVPLIETYIRSDDVGKQNHIFKLYKACAEFGNMTSVQLCAAFFSRIYKESFVSFLLKEGTPSMLKMELESRGAKDVSALLVSAIEQKEYEQARVILDISGIDITSVDSNNRNILHFVSKHPEAISILQKVLRIHSASTFLNQLDASGETPLYTALKHRNLSAIQIFLRLENIRLEPRYIFESAFLTHTETLDAIFSRMHASEFVNYTNANGVSTLMQACFLKNYACIEKLLQNPFTRTTLQDTQGNTALHYFTSVSDSNPEYMQTLRSLLVINPKLADIKNAKGLRPSNISFTKNNSTRRIIRQYQAWIPALRKNRNTVKNSARTIVVENPVTKAFSS